MAGEAGRLRPAVQTAALAWFLATPLFALVDLAFGLPVRVAGLDDPSHRLAYYGGCLLFGVAGWAWPRGLPALVIGESAANLTLLVVHTMLPVFTLSERVLAGDAVGAPVTPTAMANFLIIGSVLTWSIRRNQAALGGRRREGELA
jgi:hypothetical protein